MHYLLRDTLRIPWQARQHKEETQDGACISTNHGVVAHLSAQDEPDHRHEVLVAQDANQALRAGDALRHQLQARIISYWRVSCGEKGRIHKTTQARLLPAFPPWLSLL